MFTSPADISWGPDTLVQPDVFVVPIEERSLDAYENGWKKAIDLGIYNQWTAKMREALGRLNAELYPNSANVRVQVGNSRLGWRRL